VRISLITDIFSDGEEIEVVRRLSGDDAQSFVDVIDEVIPHSFISGERDTDLNSTLPYCRVDVGYPGAVAPEEMPERLA